jgi:endonuclease/exonuclease/phosphatase (EEP) superfamily protein YafD
VLCFLSVLASWAALRIVGESWWLAAAYLYLPHAALLAPIAALSVVVAAIGPRRVLALHAVSALVVLFPIMGLEVSSPRAPTPGAARLRILSFNVATGARGAAGLVEEARRARPDVVVLQESTPAVNAAFLAAFPDFATWASAQFLIASRHPIVRTHEPDKILHEGLPRSPRFVQATIRTPLGEIDVLDVHPISPREALESVRGNGILYDLRTGALFARDSTAVSVNTALRRKQLEAIAELAASSPNTVVIAGDTNLPGPSRLRRRVLGRWTDGFEEVGRGFGFTFPVSRRAPWMRIDRILASSELRFLEFGVGESRASDHRAVWAELERRGFAAKPTPASAAR